MFLTITNSSKIKAANKPISDSDFDAIAGCYANDEGYFVFNGLKNSGFWTEMYYSFEGTGRAQSFYKKTIDNTEENTTFINEGEFMLMIPDNNDSSITLNFYVENGVVSTLIIEDGEYYGEYSRYNIDDETWNLLKSHIYYCGNGYSDRLQFKSPYSGLRYFSFNGNAGMNESMIYTTPSRDQTETIYYEGMDKSLTYNKANPTSITVNEGESQKVYDALSFAIFMPYIGNLKFENSKGEKISFS